MKPYRTRIEDVPLEQGLREEDGWIDMQVQFLIGAHNAGASDLVVGRTVLTPGKPSAMTCSAFAGDR